MKMYVNILQPLHTLVDLLNAFFFFCQRNGLSLWQYHLNQVTMGRVDPHSSSILHKPHCPSHDGDRKHVSGDSKIMNINKPCHMQIVVTVLALGRSPQVSRVVANWNKEMTGNKFTLYKTIGQPVNELN